MRPTAPVDDRRPTSHPSRGTTGESEFTTRAKGGIIDEGVWKQLTAPDRIARTKEREAREPHETACKNDSNHTAFAS
jgi:hypothetical protein